MMRARLPKVLSGGLVAAALAVAVGGAAFAQTPPAAPSGTPPTGVQQRAEEFLNALANKLGKSPDEVRAAMTAAQKDVIVQAVQAGRLTQEQADQLNQRIDQGGGPGFVKGGGLGFLKGGFGGGHRGHGKGGMVHGRHGEIGDVAQFLGVPPQELAAELQSGKSLAQVAQEKGKSRDDLKAYLTSQAKTRLDQAVQAGRLTQQQADQQLQDMSSRLDQMIDRTGPVGGPRGGKRGFPGQRGAPGTNAPTPPLPAGSGL